MITFFEKELNRIILMMSHVLWAETRVKGNSSKKSDMAVSPHLPKKISVTNCNPREVRGPQSPKRKNGSEGNPLSHSCIEPFPTLSSSLFLHLATYPLSLKTSSQSQV